MAANTSTLITSGTPVSSSSTDANKAAATLPARWASLPASLAKKSMIPKVVDPGMRKAYQTGVKDSALTKGRAFYMIEGERGTIMLNYDFFFGSTRI